MEEDGNSQAMPLPRLKPFPSITYGSSGSAMKVPDDLKLVCSQQHNRIYTFFLRHWQSKSGFVLRAT